MKTFKDLYEFLQLHEEESIINWLKQSWNGKDKQESLLRLFSGLGLIEKLKLYHSCKGNYNNGTVIKHTTYKDIFYNENNDLVNLKDKGDKSDLTMICKENNKKILVTSSKNKKDQKSEGIGKYDIRDIHSIYATKYTNFDELVYCICTRNSEMLLKKIANCEECNKDIQSKLRNQTTIIIDWNDLDQAYKQFKEYYSQKSLDSIMKTHKNALCLKLHQRLGVLKTLRMKKEGNKTILWGHIQRSGKSYIIGGCIIFDSIGKDECNYMIITTAPNETLDQLRKAVDCIQLDDFNIVLLNGNNKDPHLTKKNIIICSKQFLQNKINEDKNIDWLTKMLFDMRFLDESHNGGTTKLAKNVLDVYGKFAFTVKMTATYSKPINDYNIPKDCWILWDLEDIKLCKNITDDNSIERLVEKHGDCIKNIIQSYTVENIKAEYSEYPELWVLTDEIKPDVVSEIVNETKDNNYGWSTTACFLLKEGIKQDNGEDIVIKKSEFQNKTENLKIWYKIFGKKNKFGIPDKDYPDNIVFMKRIEKICKDPTIDSRFIGDEDEPMIILAFLPQNDIDMISKATIKILEKNKVIPEYHIVSINSETTNNPKETIENARTVARNTSKKGVLVLSGKQCSLGVSIDNCDIVLLLNNNTSYDMIYQMMFRSMTQGRNKKCGFVVDLNIHRVIETSLINYASQIKPNLHPKKGIKFILQERLINLNGDHWMETFGNNVSNINTLCKNIYEIYSSNTEKVLDYYLNRLRFKHILLTNDEQKLFNAMFSRTIPTERQKELLGKLNENENTNQIKKGIEKTTVAKEDKSSSSQSQEDDNNKKQINYMDILKHIIPLICLFTIHSTETSFVEMFEIMKKNKYLYNIFVHQTKNWWGKSVDTEIITKFIAIYTKYMKDDKETNQIIRTVKELFVKNIDNSNELSKLIEKYLIPLEFEKKSNAEVSTPFELKRDMLHTVPKKFWKSIKKVFEPCAGKSGFILDIIHKFMKGLKNAIPDKKKRYKTILEECLYFSDINPTNIFICKLLIDPYNEYNLNYHEGDTLKLDIKKKWNIDGFDGVFGNPPYNSSGDTGTGNTIWQDFTKKSLDEFLNPDGYLLFVHPSGWRKPNTIKGKFHGLYDLMTCKNQMLYLSIHGLEEGKRIFKCGTRFDWYLIKKTPKYTTTLIDDQKNNQIEIDLNSYTWLPNYDITRIESLLAKENEEKCNIIQSMSAYEPRKKWMSATKTSKFKYPCIHTTPQKGPVYRFSEVNDRGHFGVSKVIFGDSGINEPIVDMKGIYGMTQHSMAIGVENETEANELVQALKSTKMKLFIESCQYSTYSIDWNIFKDLRKEFWKEFI